MEEQDELYLKAFNNGYLLAKYEPQLAATLSTQNLENNDYFKGLISGKREYEKEIELEQWLNRFANKTTERDEKSLDRKR